MKSMPPPGACGTINRTVLLGYEDALSVAHAGTPFTHATTIAMLVALVIII
jgi:hypothetical protein